MLLVNASAGESRIHGQGLIARESIPAGTVIWELKSGFDVELTIEQFNELSRCVRQQVGRYIYTDTTTGKLVLCSDDAKFMNHSASPNTRTVGSQTTAIADILPGDELTCDYNEFDAGRSGSGEDFQTGRRFSNGTMKY